MELLEELMAKSEELSQSMKLLRKNGIKRAEAECAYKKKLTEEILKLKAEKFPATLIAQMVYGVPEVAQVRLERDIAQVMYDANQEHINVKKLQIRILESQIDREWHSGGKNG